MKIKINPSHIDWNNNENYLFVHPKQKQVVDLDVLNNLSLQGHLFVMTSGTKGRKCVALSKKAFLHSAKAVNEHLQVKKEDRWLVCLPLFHVGGLSILARSFISGSFFSVLQDKWDPFLFFSSIKEKKITLTSLIPTQIYDLVHLNLKSPPSLRAVVVGGGVLHENLYQAARKLNWPVLPSYGLTEVSSQVATANLISLHSSEYPRLRILNHCQIQIKQGFIAIQSPALLTEWVPCLKNSDYNFEENSLTDGWFLTEDQGEVQENNLKVFGRHKIVKIKGENVSLYALENVLQGILVELGCQKDYQLLATPHARNQHQIDLVTSQEDLSVLYQVFKRYNEKVLSFEKVKNCYFVNSIPTGNLSKVQTDLLKKKIGFLL